MLRRIAHPMLATAFVVDGIDTLTNPDPRVKTATAALQKGERQLPSRLAQYLPDDPARLIRINAAVRIGGGVLLAFGKLPRLSTAVLAATVVPAALSEQGFWTEQDPERRAAKRTALLKDVSLLGGLLIASTDRQGKPSLGWRGRRAIGKLHSDTGPAHDRLVHLADAAKEHGPELAATLRERGERLADAAREHGPELVATLRERGEHLADAARDHGPELVAAVRDRGERLVDVAQHRGEQLAQTTRDVGAQWGKTASDRGGQLLDAAREHGGNLAESAREHGGQLAEAVREHGAQLAGAAREQGGQLAGTAREQGGRLAHVARERGERAADAARDATRRTR
ncbi:DoxX family membrane protein [Nocardia aurantiaca]|uniref:DoxX family membrane protein n=1 Tax=Nocardia aurantiaca TaxID=2675850 RepID=A0A6I3L1Z2_9NOCA|nr:DoxX family membrane protein [Nocardia aurantiaca]MTE15711.1 DoxX family membrane protein [Nocardia aurantiaca]